jgi:hypothetical protein
LHYATNGVVGNVMNLLRQSAYVMEQTGGTTLTLAILSHSFQKRLHKHVGKPDPFDGSLCAARHLAASDPPESVGRRSRRRKEKQTTAAEVLTTR